MNHHNPKCYLYSRYLGAMKLTTFKDVVGDVHFEILKLIIRLFVWKIQRKQQVSCPIHEICAYNEKIEAKIKYHLFRSGNQDFKQIAALQSVYSRCHLLGISSVKRWLITLKILSCSLFSHKSCRRLFRDIEEHNFPLKM